MTAAQAPFFSQWLEGSYNPAGRPAGEAQQFERISRSYGGPSEGIFGAKVTGVISHADMNANHAGLTFYARLFNSFVNLQPFNFAVANIRVQLFNEQLVPNTFTDGVVVDDSDKPGPLWPWRLF